MNDIQKKELEVLKEVVKIIEKHNLSYFAIGGTCIGAIRHKGFIPWDDDIDIAMPRNDYELFRTKLYKELPNNLEINDPGNSKSNVFNFIKIHDKNTSLISNYCVNYPDWYTGAFIDIMPIDGIPSNLILKKLVLFKYSLIQHLNVCLRYNYDKRKRIKSCIKFIIKKLLSRLNYNYFYCLLIQESKKYVYDVSDYICFTWRIDSNCDFSRKVYNKKFFSSYIELSFEDTIIRVPVYYDLYLKQDFGNYMEIPKESERIAHTIVISDMNKPIKYYVENNEIVKEAYRRLKNEK